MNRALLPLLLALGGAALGCFSPGVPVGAKLECTGVDDCPPEHRCSAATNRCVREDDEVDPPGVVDGSVVAPTDPLAPGAPITITFTVDEPLFGDPVVKLDKRDELPDVRMARIDDDAADGDALTFTFLVDVVSAHGEGTRTASVHLVDVVGNEADVTLATLTLDQTKPALVNPPATPQPVSSQDATVSFSLTTNERVRLPVVTVGDGAGGAGGAGAVVVEDGDSGTEFNVTYTPSGDEPAEPPVRVSLLDIAGNLADETLTPFLFDFVPPVLIDVDAPSTAALGERIVVAVRSSEPLADLSGARLVDAADDSVSLPLTVAFDDDRLTATLSLDVDASTAEGDFALAIDAFSDAAGNVVAVVPGDGLARVRIDRSPPVVSDVVAPSAPLAPGRALTISFRTSEPLVDVAEPVVTLAAAVDVTLSRVDDRADPAAFTYAVDIVSGHGEGAFVVGAVVADAAGNVTNVATLATVTLDRTAPSLVSAPTSPAPVSSDDATISFAMTTSEPVGVPVVTVETAGGAGNRAAVVTEDAGGGGAAGTRWLVTYAPGGDEGLLPIADVTLVDVAGNVSPLTLIPWTFDFDAPAIVQVTAPSVAALGDRIVLAMRTNEAIGAVGGAALVDVATGTVSLPLAVDIDDDELGAALSLDVTAGTAEGTFALAIASLEDLAGNGSAVDVAAGAAFGTVRIDRTPAGVGDVSAPSTPLAPGRALTLSFTTSEALLSAADPVVTLNAAVAVPLARVDDRTDPTRFTYSADIVSAHGEGAFVVGAVVVDDAGNDTAVANLATVTLDRTGPALLAAPTSPALISGEDATASFALTTSEPVALPVVTLEVAGAPGGERAASVVEDVAAGGAPGTRWTVTYAPVGDEGAQPLARVSLVDVAGNAALLTLNPSPFAFDFIAPAIVQVSGPAVARLGQRITILVDTSEPIAASFAPASAALVDAGTGGAVASLPLGAVVDGDGLGAQLTFDVTASTAEGDFVLAVAAGAFSDAAGNPGAAVPFGAGLAPVRIDRTPPVLSDVDAPATALAPGRALDISFTVSEPIVAAADPVVTLAAAVTAPLTRVDDRSDPTRMTYSVDIVSAHGEGPFVVSAVVVDDAGNQTSVGALATVTLDRGTPSLVAAPTSPALVSANDPSASFSITTSEPVALPVVTVDTPSGARAAGVVEDGTAPPDTRFTVTYAPAGNELAEPIARVTLVDVAGNQVELQLVPFHFDFVAPGIDEVAFPLFVGLDRRGTVSFNANEPLARAPAVTLFRTAGGPPLSLPLSASLAGPASVVATIDVTSSTAEGTFDVRVASLEDAAGNVSAALSGLGTVLIDRTPPAATSTPGPAPARIGPSSAWGVDAVFAEPVVVEDLLVAGIALAPSTFACLVTGGSVDCAVDAGATSASGPAPLSLVVTDAAQNLSVVGVGVLTVDRTGPQLVTAALSRLPERTQAATAGPGGVPLFSRTDPFTDGAVTAVVNIVADEALSGTVTLARSTSPATFTFTCTVTSSQSRRCEKVLDGNDPVTNALVVTWQDDLGNVSGPLPVNLTVQIDDTVPTLNMNQVTLARFPWGRLNEAPSPKIGVTVNGAVNAAEFLLLAADGPVADNLLASGAINGSGFGGVNFALADRAIAFVAPVSAAGVRGVTSQIRRIEWTATMGGKVVGSDLENPHEFEERQVFLPHQRDDTAAISGLATTFDDATFTTTQVLPSWRTIGTPRVMVKGETSDFVFGTDQRRGVVVAYDFDNRKTFEARNGDFTELPTIDPEGDGVPSFSGSDAQMPFLGRLGQVVQWDNKVRRVYRWDGRSWIDVPATGTTPSLNARDFAAGAVPGGAIMIFSGTGQTAGVALDEALVFDGAAWTDARIGTIGTTRPAPRAAAALTYLPTRDVSVLAGGMVLDVPGACAAGATKIGTTCHFTDTWEWNGASWTRVATANLPTGLFSATAAFDRRSARLVLFSGGRQFVYNNTTWIEVADGGGVQPGFADAMYDDPRTGRAMVTGFVSGLGSAVFRWSGTEWLIEGAHNDFDGSELEQPLDRFESQPSTGPDGKMFFFSGMPRDAACNPTTLCTDQWRYSGAAYVKQLPAVFPPARMSAGIALDVEGGNDNFMFGGFADGTFASLQDTWRWNGNNWAQVCTTAACLASRPSARGHTAMADVPGVGVLLFGGETQFFANSATNDTFTFDGSLWVRCTAPTCTGANAPPARTDHTMAFDDVTDTVILFGGTPNPAAPFPGVLFADTWRFTPGPTPAQGAWTRIDDGTNGPPGRTASKLVPLPGVGLVLIGGNGLPAGDTDIWVFDGATSTWDILDTTDPESDGDILGRAWPPAAFDADEDGIVVFSGSQSPRDLSSFLSANGTERPGHIMRVQFASSSAPLNATITDIELIWVAGGTSVGGNGVELLGWNGNTFIPLQLTAPHNAPVGAPAGVSFNANQEPKLDTAAERASFFIGTERELALAVRPKAAQGRVATDAVQVRVHYTLP